MGILGPRPGPYLVGLVVYLWLMDLGVDGCCCLHGLHGVELFPLPLCALVPVVVAEGTPGNDLRLGED